jgi:glycosyltransferase involved in cell wall biosynthesis
MKKIVFLTHENLEKTPVSKAMFEDIVVNLSSDDMEFTIFSAAEEKDINEKGKIKHYHFKRSSYGKISLSALFSLLASYIMFLRILFKNDIFLYRSYPTMMMFGWISWLFGKKNIFDTRGLFFEELFDSGKLQNKTIQVFFKFVEKILLRLSHKIIVVTQGQAEYYINMVPKVQSTIFVNPNGAPKKEIIESKINSDRLELVYVGSLVKWHSPELVHDVCKSLSKLGVDYHLTVFTKDLEKAHEVFDQLNDRVMIKTHNYRNTPICFHYGFCFITGGVSKDICFPVKFLEYVQSGTKVIGSSNVRVVKELITQFDLGISVDLNLPPDEIAHLIINDSLLNKNKITDLPEQYTFEQQSLNIKNILEEI